MPGRGRRIDSKLDMFLELLAVWSGIGLETWISLLCCRIVCLLEFN